MPYDTGWRNDMKFLNILEKRHEQMVDETKRNMDLGVKKAIKWGVLGTAGIAERCTIPGILNAKDSELYAIAGRSLEKAEAFQERFGFEKAYQGYDALLADGAVDAVYIPLPNDIHCEWVIKALNAKKHVLCEKPIAMNESELRLMFRTAKENGVVLMEAFAYLHSPYISRLKALIADGEIGKIDYIDTAFLTQGYSEDFRLYKEYGGGGIYDIGCYSTSMILTLVDAPISYIRADAELDANTGVDHMASVLIGFSDGTRASFHAGMILGTDSSDRYDRLFIHGSKGYIRSDVEYNGEGKLCFDVTVKDAEGARHTRTETVYAGSNYSMEIEQMNACIRGEASPHITEKFSIENMRLLDRILDTVGYTDAREAFILPNGVSIPAVGFGSYLAAKHGTQTILDALQTGYRYIDTAKFYENESEIGAAVAESGLAREELFLCSKVWHTDLGREKTLASFAASCQKLRTDYLDMLLIHWPKREPDDANWLEMVRESWAVMEELYAQGKVRVIGLSNFLPHHIRPLLETAKIRPMVDQLELHVGYMQEYTLSYLKAEGILPQAWSPLGRAKLLEDNTVLRMAKKYGCTATALLLRYLIQRGIPVIPKASSPERMKENLDVFGFAISADDMSYLSCLPQRGWSGEHPDFEESN